MTLVVVGEKLDRSVADRADFSTASVVNQPKDQGLTLLRLSREEDTV